MNRIVHLALKVDDLERTTEFYEKVFGFKETEHREGARPHLAPPDRRRDRPLAHASTTRARSPRNRRPPGKAPASITSRSKSTTSKTRRSRSNSYGCEIISDPGVIPVKFRAPGGTVCELVPRALQEAAGRSSRGEEAAWSEAARAAISGPGSRSPRSASTSSPRRGAGSISAPDGPGPGVLPAVVRHRAWSRCRALLGDLESPAAAHRRERSGRLDAESGARSRPGSAFAVLRRAAQDSWASCQLRAAHLLHRRRHVPPAARESPRWSPAASCGWLLPACSRWRSAWRCRGVWVLAWRSSPACCRASRSRSQPVNLLWCFVGVVPRHGGRHPAGARAAGDRSRCCCRSPSSMNPTERDHHARRHLLRRQVRRLDHLDPAQRAGRVGLGRHLPRRLPDGAQGPRRRRARHRRDRLVHRRHGRA